MSAFNNSWSRNYFFLLKSEKYLEAAPASPADVLKKELELVLQKCMPTYSVTIHFQSHKKEIPT